MDKTTLVGTDRIGLIGVNIEDGERLLRALDEANLDIYAALWFYLSESDLWRFIVASPLVDKEGPREVYALIQSELSKLTPPLSEISLKNISVMGLEDDLIKILRVGIPRHERPGGFWFVRNVIDNVFIEAAYIYRIR